MVTLNWLMELGILNTNETFFNATRVPIPSKIFTRSQMTFQNIHPQSDDLPYCDLPLRSPALMHLPFWPFQKVDFQYLLDPFFPFPKPVANQNIALLLLGNDFTMQMKISFRLLGGPLEFVEENNKMHTTQIQ